MSDAADVGVRLAFRKYDLDGSGHISAGELEALCEELGAPLRPQELETVLRQLDTDSDGEVSLLEFERWWSGRADAQVDSTLRQLAAKGRRENHVDIHSACWDGAADVVAEFLQVDPTLAQQPDTTEFGESNTPLHYACYQGHLGLARTLVDEHRVPVNARNQAGCTPLFLASQQGRGELVRFLVSKGARINLADSKHGLCPIRVAATDEIRALLEAGCDTSAPRAPARRPEVKCPRPGLLEVSWSYRGAEKSSAKSLAVTAFVVQVLLCSEDNPEDSDSGSEAEQRPEVERAVPQVLREVTVQGADASCAEIAVEGVASTVQARVAARHAQGQSEWSPPSEAIRCVAEPSPPKAPTVQRVSRASLRISWAATQGNGCRVLKYRLEGAEWDGSAPGEWFEVDCYKASQKEAELDNLTAGRSYVFRLVAANIVGKSKPGPPSKPAKIPGRAWSGARR